MKLALGLAAALIVLTLVPQALARPAVLHATTATVPAAAGAKAPNVLIRDVRMCTNEAFVRSQFRCARDERSRPFTSTAAVCTMTIYAYSAVTVRASMTFGGKVLFSQTRKYPRRTRVSLAVSFELPLTLPAGSYSCTVKIGKKRASARMRSAGPAGPLAFASACLSSNVFPRTQICARDESATPIGPTSSLTCSGIFAGQQGKQAVVELLYNANGTWTSVFAAPITLRGPIFAALIVVPGLLSQPYAAGEYACRFSLAGQVLLEKPFTVRS